MHLENIYRYVNSGSIFSTNKKDYRRNSFGPFLLTAIVGLVPGIILGSYFLVMTIALSIIALLCVFSVFIISFKILTSKICLILDCIIFGSWVIEISILEFMYFSLWRGPNPWILLIYIPTILIPLLLGVKIHRLLKNSNYSSKNVIRGGVKTVSWIFGLQCVNFAAVFRNVDQSVAFIIVLLGFSILNAFMSLGLLSVQKLYYAKKYNIRLE